MPIAYLICPSPRIYHFSVTSFSKANGQRACSFCVDIPISAPKPNSPPSVNQVEAFTYTAAASTVCKNITICCSFFETIHSECLEEYFSICSKASDKPSTAFIEHLKSKNSLPKSPSCACVKYG